MSVANSPTLADDALFHDKVAPIFERHCVACHQGEKPKGGLSLTTAGRLKKGGESGVVIEPGKPDESLLVELISGEKPAMPQKARPLSKDDVAAIRQWIAEGAKWPADLALRDKRLAGADDQWWSLQPIKRPMVPKVESTSVDKDWARTPIDTFVLAKLDEKKLAPSPEADRRTLIRRLTFDLTGLPATPQEVEDFAQTGDYASLVERLLKSPRYGEQQARHWLDVVRYADTAGFSNDFERP
ncbi:MAG TPA: DUF1549 domain-containing protein, partial [Planctomycetaceae bacterium]